MPRYGVWRNKGMVYLAPNQKRLQIVQDICAHTVKSIQQAEFLGGWQALPRQDLFDVEYWELEQAKLKTSAHTPEFEGKVVVVTGAASGYRQGLCRGVHGPRCRRVGARYRRGFRRTVYWRCSSGCAL